MQVRTALSSTEIWACPPLGGSAKGYADGVFTKYTIATPQPAVAAPTPTLVTPAGPPRDIPLAPHGKPQEVIESTVLAVLLPTAYNSLD